MEFRVEVSTYNKEDIKLTSTEYWDNVETLLRALRECSNVEAVIIYFVRGV